MSTTALPPKKLASSGGSSGNFQRTFLRSCADRMKALELRLDHGCGPGWLRQVDRCEDLAALGRLLLPLQRCCAGLRRLDNAWLERLSALSPAELEEQHGDLSRRMVQRLEEVDRAIPPARKPTDMLGEVVLKHFDGHGTFIGTIVEFDAQTGFRLQFDDGDSEDVSLRDLRKFLPRPPGSAEAGGEEEADVGVEPSAKRPKKGGGAAAKPKPSSAAAATTVLEGAAVPAYRSLAAAEPPQKPAPKPASRTSSRDRSGGANGHADAAAAKAPAEGAASKAAIKAAVTVAAPAAASSERPQKAAGAPSEPVCDSKRLFEDSAEEAAQLPAGWMIEQKGRGRVFVSPDGLTRFSTLAKVLRWHKQQMALAARFESQQAAQAAKVSEVDVSRTERAEARKPGFEVPEELKDLGKEGDGKGGDKGKKKEVPRELRNLAMPDREWKVEMPIVGTVAPPLTMPTASPKGAARAASAGAASGGEERASTPLVAEEDEMPL